MGNEMPTFGEFFKQKRLALGKTLREFCREHNLDPGNISKMERGKMAPPLGRLEEYARCLCLNSSEWETFKELAELSAGRIPSYLRDKDTLARLPIFFRALRGKEVSETKLKEIAEEILKS